MMPDYQKLYTRLFNAVTDAVAELDAMNVGRAKALLISAQQQAEDTYVETACPEESAEAGA